MFHDSQWGQGHNTPREDPLLVSRYATNYVRWLQLINGWNPNRLKVATYCKHHTAYDLDNWNGVDHFPFDAKLYSLIT